MKVDSNKVVNQIYQTADYSIFEANFMNRDINVAHVNNLYKDMLVNGWLKGSYIIVNLNGKLISGHHRLLAATKAKVPVSYVIEDIADDDVSSVCKITRNWNIIDHLRHFVKLGNPHYVVLDRFMKNFPTLRPTEAMMLVKNSGTAQARFQFEQGSFETKSMDIAYQWGHNIMSLRPYFDGYCKSIFVRALIRVLQNPQFNFDEFLHKVKLRPSMIHMCGTVEQYLEMIEEIYNYRRKTDEKVNLRF
jgi:hypothetical protein